MSVVAAGTAAAVATAACCPHCGNATSVAGAFCCAGCEGAYRLIGRLGLETYYRRRPNLVAAPSRDVMAVDPTPYVRLGDDVCELDLAVEGLHCAACVWLIESAVARDPAVRVARLNASQRRLHLAWHGSPQRAAEFAGLVGDLGYRVAPWTAAAAIRLADDEEKYLLRCLAVAGFATANVMMLSVAVWAGSWGGTQGMGDGIRDLLHWISAIVAVPALLYAIRPFARSAWGALMQGRGNMDLPIVVGVALTVIISLTETIGSGRHAYFESASMLLFVLLVARYLERRVRGRARSAAAHLASLTAGVAMIETSAGSLRPVTPAQLAVGDILHLASGERCLADSCLLSAEARIDNSVVSGESAPLPLRVGDRIYAGAINIGPAVRARVECIGEGTLLASLSRLLAAAEQGRSRYVGLADRVARWYAPAVHALAALTAGLWYVVGDSSAHDALLAAVAVLIVTCPCALALAQPAVATVVIDRLATKGVLVVSPSALERLAAVDTIVLDKTGTLTQGRPVLMHDAARDPEALHQAAALALASRHPLARALATAAPEAAAAVGVIEYPGQGLQLGAIRLGSRRFCDLAAVDDDDAEPASEMWLTRPDAEPTRFVFRDELRSDARAVVESLRRRGFRVQLVSGDRKAAVAQAARDVGIDDWIAAALPHDKLATVMALQDAGRRVLMVGDGINDAPALAAAHASLAPGDATDIASAAADALFRGDRLQPIVDALDLAQRAQRAMRVNLRLAVLYNLVAVPVAMLGMLTPPVAAAAMSGSSLLVVANALRLGRSGIGTERRSGS